MSMSDSCYDNLCFATTSCYKYLAHLITHRFRRHYYEIYLTDELEDMAIPPRTIISCMAT